MTNFNFLAFLMTFLISFIISQKIGTNPSKNQFLSVLNESSNLTSLIKDTGKSTRQLDVVKCFWLEPNTHSLFYLKNLKRPIGKR